MRTERLIALKAAHAAGALHKEKLGHVSCIDYKSAFNLVTEVDKAAENLILEILKAEFPNDNYLAEETGASKSSQSTRRWLIDPLDGTTNYAHAYPFFCVSIALEEDGEITLGVVYNAVSDELFWAEKGLGARLNDRVISTSSVPTLSASLLATGFPPDSRNSSFHNMTEFTTITHASHGVRRDGSAALDLCFVACGRLDGFWEKKLAPWDVAAGSLIVREAGGRVTNLENGPLDMNSGHILATNGHIHRELVGVFQECFTASP